MESVTVFGRKKRSKQEETCKKIKEYKTPKNPETKAYQAAKRCFHFIEFFGKLLGWQFIYEWKSNLRHWCATTVVVLAITQSLYTLFNQLMNQEYKRVLNAFTVLCIAVSRFEKTRCFASTFKELTAVHRFSFKIFHQDYGQLSDKLENELLQSLKKCKMIILMAVSSAAIYVYYPIVSIIHNQEWLSLLPIEIMFINQSSLSGYFIANAFMVIMGVYSAVIALYMGLHFVASIDNFAMQVNIIEHHINKLDELWNDSSETSIAERHSFMRNICKLCQDKENYIARVKLVFDETIFVFFCFGYVSIIICLYVVKAENWRSGYGVAFGLFVEMMFYCIVGTKVTTTNDRLSYILTQSKWYTYDNYSQNTFQLLLSSSMNCKTLSIGPLAPLSVFTLTEIVKGIYTYYTFLVEAI